MRGRQRETTVEDEQPLPPPYSFRRRPQPSPSVSRHDSASEIQHPPPPYTSRLRVARSPAPHPIVEAAEIALRSPGLRVERLRRFLSFTLAVDYDLQDVTPDKLTDTDWSRFVRLAQQLADACSAAVENKSFDQFWKSDDHPESIMTTALRLQIIEPANTLGVDPQVVLVQLMLFVSSINHRGSNGGYVSQLDRMPAILGVYEFALKLLCDRTRLFKAVLPKTHKAMSPYRGLKTQMMVRNQTAIDRWFTKLDWGGYDVRRDCVKDFADTHRFPVEMFVKETKAATALHGLLRDSTWNMTYWRKWKRRAAKRSEGRLYVRESGRAEASMILDMLTEMET